LRGITFEIPNTYRNFLFEILDGTNIKELTWRIGDGEELH